MRSTAAQLRGLPALKIAHQDYAPSVTSHRGSIDMPIATLRDGIRYASDKSPLLNYTGLEETKSKNACALRQMRGRMNVLITGGAGFIGSHIADRCIREGWDVTILDDLSTGAIGNIAELLPCGRVTFIQGSICSTDLVNELIQRVSLVFHLAAAVGVRTILSDPFNALQTNVRGTHTVIEAAARHGKRLILASSCEVYGKHASSPCREDSDLQFGSSTTSRWSYACSKAIAEYMALAAWQVCAAPFTIARFFNTVGPRQTHHYGMVLPQFVRQALFDEPVTVYGSGNQTRSFIYVGDLVDILLRIAKTDSTIGEVINVGTPEEISITALAELVIKVTGSRSPVTYVPYEQAYGAGFEDICRLVPCVKKLHTLVGEVPRTPLAAVIGMLMSARSPVNHFRHAVASVGVAG